MQRARVLRARWAVHGLPRAVGESCRWEMMMLIAITKKKKKKKKKAVASRLWALSSRVGTKRFCSLLARVVGFVCVLWSGLV